MSMKIKPHSMGWLLSIVYLVGILGFSYGPTKLYFAKLIWVNLLITLIVLFVYHKKWSFDVILACVLVGVSGFLLEVIGVNTKFVFGNYFYGPSLGYSLWNTPLMMFVNWLTVVYISRQIAEKMAKDPVAVASIASLLMLILDYFIEPFAMKYGMWSWFNNIVPIQNYIAWFVAGFVLQYAFMKSVKFPENKLSLPVYIIQLSFFVVLYLVNTSS
jgi:uncharacterized membrane protein